VDLISKSNPARASAALPSPAGSGRHLTKGSVMPRRRTHADAIRNRVISIRVREAELERLKSEASAAGLSVSGLAEKLVCEGKVITRSSGGAAPLSPALLAELRRIGNNLNQIAHAVNSNLPPDVRFTTTTLHQLIQQLARDEILAERLKVAAQRIPSNDSAPPQARSEFQRRVQLHPARSE
jgi:primosomal protein N''